MNTGVELLGFVQSVRRFCGQLADLLGAADRLVGQAGWDSLSSVAYASSSASIDKPERWFPREVFRFYRTEDSPHLLMWVALLLDDDRKKEYSRPLTEPLATAGWFEFPEQAPESVGADRLWWSRFHGYMDDRRDDGTINTVVPKEAWKADYREDYYPFTRASTLATPLAGVTTVAQLDERLIAPLLAAIGDARRGRG